jgi:hypothetical protein
MARKRTDAVAYACTVSCRRYRLLGMLRDLRPVRYVQTGHMPRAWRTILLLCHGAANDRFESVPEEVWSIGCWECWE